MVRREAAVKIHWAGRYALGSRESIVHLALSAQERAMPEAMLNAAAILSGAD
jgi:hypothetical protein